MQLIDTEKWAEIFDTIKRHKLRTFLTALSVWWGMFMLIILLGAGSGLENSVEHNFRDDAINSLWMYRGMTSQAYKGLPVGRRIQFDTKDYDLLVDEIDGVAHVTGRYYIGGNVVTAYKNKGLSFDTRCVHPDHKVLENTIVVEGRFINDTDIKEYRKVCAIGTLVKKAFFEDGQNAIGEYLNIKGIDYKVVGVYDDTGHENELRKIYLPISTCQKVYEGKDRIHQLMMTIGDADVKEAAKIEKHVFAQMAALHKFSPDDDQAIYISNGVEEYAEFKMVMGFIKGFIWFVGVGSILAGMIGVSNIMLIIVKDRTKEIGIRKALGATPRSIIAMILQESVFITAIAGYVGLLAGFGIIYGLNGILLANEVEIEFFRNPEVNFTVVLTALILLVICGALAGLIPAIQAVRVNPVTAMRS